jgi:hypothetical protein
MKPSPKPILRVVEAEAENALEAAAATIIRVMLASPANPAGSDNEEFR